MAELKDFVRAVARHYVVLLTGIVLLLLGLANQFFSGEDRVDEVTGLVEHAPLLPNWAFAVAVATLFFYACFLAWRDSDTERQRLKVQLAEAEAAPPPEAPQGHIDGLRATAKGLRRLVATDGPIDISNPTARALAAHIPELGSSLQAWADAVEAAVDLHRAFSAWLTEQLDAEGFVEPFMLEPARNKLQSIFQSEALRLVRELDVQGKRFYLQRMYVESEMGVVQGGPPFRVAMMEGGWGNESWLIRGLESHEVALGWHGRVNELFTAAVTSAPLASTMAAERHREELKVELIPALDEVEVSFTFTRVTTGCPLCPSIISADVR